MKRKEFIQTTSLGLTTSFAGIQGLLNLNKSKDSKRDSQTTWNGDRPNILWITCEDTSSYFFPFYGDSTIKTPNLSWLASEGITFDRMFSTYGVCAPSRSSIITGMYPESIGAMDMRTMTAESHSHIPGLVDYQVVPPPEVRCFTEYLRAAGYYCTNNKKQIINLNHLLPRGMKIAGRRHGVTVLPVSFSIRSLTCLLPIHHDYGQEKISPYLLIPIKCRYLPIFPSMIQLSKGKLPECTPI